MVDRLYAYMQGHMVGKFTRTGADLATFDYTPDYDGLPLSLSMPIGGRWAADVPFNYLDNLLPEDDEARERLAAVYQVTPDVFDLLSHIGEDVAGAVTLSTDSDLPRRQPVPMQQATDDDIAYRIAQLRRDPTAPPPNWITTRWSLAGQQAKFSLARIGDQWFWSTYEVASTHIFKPAWEKHRKAEQAEVACLNLAKQCDIAASNSRVAWFKGQSVFMVERWDRLPDGGGRLHAEDMVQALGMHAGNKYSTYFDDVLALLRPYNQEWPYVRQMLFNLAIGNSDAHGKNYSLLLTSQGAHMAPLYDALPLFLWPQYDQTPSLFINHKPRLMYTTEQDWIAFAETNQLDADRMVHEMRTIFTVVAEQLPDDLSGAGFDIGDKDAAATWVRHSLAPSLQH